MHVVSAFLNLRLDDLFNKCASATKSENPITTRLHIFLSHIRQLWRSNQNSYVNPGEHCCVQFEPKSTLVHAATFTSVQINAVNNVSGKTLPSPRTKRNNFTDLISNCRKPNITITERVFRI